MPTRLSRPIGATGVVEIWFQADFGSIPIGEKQVILETGGNENGLSLLAEQSAQGDTLLRVLQCESTTRNLDMTVNLAGDGAFSGLTQAELDEPETSPLLNMQGQLGIIMVSDPIIAYARLFAQRFFGRRTPGILRIVEDRRANPEGLIVLPDIDSPGGSVNGTP